MRKLVPVMLAALLLALMSFPALGQITPPPGDTIGHIVVPPSPPPPGYVPAQHARALAGDVILTNVPTYTWCYGCSATSAGMMMGYYDLHGYPNMYTGPANGGACPLNNETAWGHTYYSAFGNVGECPFIASHIGKDGRATRGYVEDYWGSPDPCVTNGWTAHTDDCVGDFMGTSQDRYSNADGSTMFYYYNSGTPLYDYNPTSGRDGCHGMRLYAEAHGYTVTTNYTQVLYNASTAPYGCTFSQYCTEIDSGYPVLIQLNGHTMLGIGYNKTGNIVYVNNTWANTYDQMTWGGTYSGMQQWGMTVLHLAPATTPNNAPTINALSNVTINENAGLQTVNMSGISAGTGDTGQTITITASSNNTAVIPNPTVTYTSPNATGTLTFTPVANTSGTATVTVTVRDNGGTANGGVDTTVKTFTVTVNFVNTAPTINALSNLTINQNAGMQTVNLSGISAGDADDAGQAISVTASSNNPGLIPTPAVVYVTPQATGTLTFTPVPNTTGTATVTVTVRDNGGTANGGVDTTTCTFNVTVNFVNTAPTLNGISNLVINENAGLQTINLSGISAGTGDTGQTITITAGSTNPAVIPNPTVTYTSPNATGTLTFTPVANTSGTATIGVTVKDNGGTANGGVDTTVKTFTVTVNFVNTAPTLDALSDVTVLENAAPTNITLTGISAGDADDMGQAITVTAASNNPGLIPNPAISYTSPNATGSLIFVPMPNTSGTATVTVTVQDNGGTANGGVDTITRTFNVTVNFVNTAPTINPLPDQEVLENAPPTTITLTGISAGDADDMGQTLTISATSDTPLLVPDPVVSYSGGSAAGLTFQPAPNQVGTVTVYVTLQDNGGTANGGVDTTTMAFNINVDFVNHAPTIDPIANQSLPVNSGAQTLPLTGIGPGGTGEEDWQMLTLTATSSNPGLIPTPNINYSGFGPSGTLTYTPVANQGGTATISVIVQDDGGTVNGGVDTTIRTFTVTIYSTPTATSGTLAVVQNTPLAFTLTGSDPGALPLSYTLVTAPAHGTLTYTATGTAASGALSSPALTYTPATSYKGTDSLAFTVSNGYQTSTSATVSITVYGKPTAGTTSLSTNQETPVNITLSGTDPLGLPITYSVATNPAHGTLKDTATGQPIVLGQAGSRNLTYTPNVGFHDVDTFTFTVTNGVVSSNPATVSITVWGKPKANAQTVKTALNTPVGFALTGSDPLGLTLTYALASLPAHGTLSYTASGLPATGTLTSTALTFTPTTGYKGTDSFTFTTYNGHLTSASATVSLTVYAKPLPGTTTLTTNQETPLTITLSATDPINAPITAYTLVSQPAHGTLKYQSTGTPAFLGTLFGVPPVLVYTPNAGFHDVDSFTFTATNGVMTSDLGTISITVWGRPTAYAKTATTGPGVPVNVTLTGTDPLGLAINIFKLASLPAHGTLTDTSSGLPASVGTLTSPNLTFTPAAGFVNGTDTFTYTVNNGHMDSTPATVTLNVAGKPNAGTTTVTTNQETPLAMALTGSDRFGLPISGYTLTSLPAHGTLTYTVGGQPCALGLLSSRSITYTPATGFHDVDSFTFTVSNGYLTSDPGTVSITVWGKPRANTQAVTTTVGVPVNFTLTGSDPLGLTISYILTGLPSHGTLTYTATGQPAVGGTLSSTALTFTPATGYKGTDFFTFTVNNGHMSSSTANINLTVYAKPTAGTTTVSTNQETPLTLTLTGSDPIGAPLTAYTLVTQPAHGTLKYLSTGTPAFLGTLFGVPPTLVYTPNTGFHDVDSFTFTVTNGYLTSNPATVSITVWGRPTAYAKTAATGPGTPVNVTLTGTDPLGLKITGYTLASLPAHGTLTDTATGLPVSGTVTNPNLTYTPAPGFSGAVDTFTYTVYNGHMTSNPATVSLTVYGKPRAGTTTLSTNQETPLTLTLTGTDPFGLAITRYTLVSLPAHGTLTYQGSGLPVAVGTLSSRTLTYTPAVGFHDVDTFTFTTFNGYLTSDPGTITITVYGRPTARAQSLTTSGGAPIALTLTGSDPLGLPLTAYTLATQPAHGTLTYTATGLPVSLGTLTSPTLTFTPTPGYKGTDAFTFTVYNGHLTSNPGTVSLTMN